MRFFGQRLRIARALRGVNQKELGEQVAASPSLLSLVENDKRAPSQDLVQALGEVLGFDHGFFFRPPDTQLTEHNCSFRKKAATSLKAKERILAHGTLLRELMLYLQGVVAVPRFDVPRVTVDHAEQAEETAEDCRLYWNLGLDAPILTLGRVLENAGVFLTEIESDATQIDAFCHWGDISVIVLSTAKGSSSRRLFDIAHETGHLVMHRGSIIKSVAQEEQANRFAAAFLLPKTGFARDFCSLRKLDWPHLLELKRHWRVSLAAILHRAHELRLLGTAEYRRFVKQMYVRGWHRGEPSEPTMERPELLHLALASAVEQLGSKFIIAELGWTTETFVEITGFDLPNREECSDIVSLADYRRRREAQPMLSFRA